jgi:hypothetical protein
VEEFNTAPSLGQTEFSGSMRKHNQDTQDVFEALSKAGELYERYLELSAIARIPQGGDEAELERAVRSVAQPLGLVIKTS